ncbi:hypothetical protein ALFP_0049 [Alcaligenes faecalis]|nr:hypothetical protein ALFP_0049 [Alcaligenes faecalis]
MVFYPKNSVLFPMTEQGQRGVQKMIIREISLNQNGAKLSLPSDKP